MFKKLIFPAFLLWIFSCWLSYADSKNEDNGKNIAQQYLESNKNDDFWKDNSPRLWEATPLYMEKEIPSYFEYRVVCERNKDCGYIVVNVDGDDVPVPTSSPTDIPPSQILTQKSGTNKEELQFYYFGIFDVYVKNILTQQINAIDPQIDPTEKNEIIIDMKEEDKKQVQEFIKEQQKKLPQIFSQKLQDWKEYKQTDTFKYYKSQIIENTYWYTIQSPGTEVKNGWKYVKWQSSSDCNSRIPCYEQYTYWYSWQGFCASWCSPVAAAMIFWYYDKEKIYPNLFPGILAPMTNTSGSWFWQDATMKNAIDEIRGYMGTECYDGEWGTNWNRVQDGIKFAENHWYPLSYPQYVNTYLSSPVSWIFTDEIDAGRPLILQLTWHDVVLYGYSLSNHYNVRINAGWWNGEYSNKDVNILWMTLDGTYYNTAGFTKYIIQ